jgi:hypothetical protein
LLAEHDTTFLTFDDDVFSGPHAIATNIEMAVPRFRNQQRLQALSKPNCCQNLA